MKILLMQLHNKYTVPLPLNSLFFRVSTPKCWEL